MNYFEIFGISFLMALTGALQPGPLLNFTILSTLRNQKKTAWMTGGLVIFGHAILEIGLIFLVLLGVTTFLENIVVIRIIGVLGGGLLVFFGLSALKNIKSAELQFAMEILEKPLEETASENHSVAESSPDSDSFNEKLMKVHPIAGGIILSLSNPYWIIWWVFVGIAVMIEYSVSLAMPSTVIVFFLGHILADFVWYSLISIFIGVGKKSINQKIYRGLLLFCGLFFVVFGVYLAIQIFFFEGTL